MKDKKANSYSIKGSPATAPGKRKYFISLLLIILVSFLAFLPVLHNGFVNWDDEGYVVNNPLIKSIHLKEIFSRSVESNYHPLTILVYAIEYQFFGLNAGGYHAINLLVHLLNVVLVFYAVSYLTEKSGVALTAALLFGIHPMHVESVAWVSELKDLLYGFFFLASYICYLRFQREQKNRLYFFCLLLFLLSLLSKAMAASLPVVFVLTDYFKGRKLTAKVWLEKMPFFALSLLFGVIAILAQRSARAIMDLDVFPLPQRIVFACYGFITYLVKLVVPYHLSALYPYPSKSAAGLPGRYYVYLFLFVVLAALVFYSLRFSKKIVFGFGFFAATVFLVLQLLPVGSAIMADRYVYLPSIGIFYLAGEGGSRLLRSLRPATSSWKLAVTLVLVVVIILSAQTYARCEVWKDGTTLWNDVIAKEETALIAYNNRGLLLVDQNRLDEALRDYNKVLTLSPRYADAYQNRGVLFANQNRYAEALRDYSQAIRLKPGFTQAYKNRALLQLNNEKLSEALEDYNQVIELDPGYATAYNNRGNIFLRTQRYDQALADYNKAVELDPTYFKAYNGHGVLLMRQEKYPEAVAQFNKAIEVEPTYGEAYFNRSIAEYYSGQKSPACRDLQQALSLKHQPAAELYSQWCR